MITCTFSSNLWNPKFGSYFAPSVQYITFIRFGFMLIGDNAVLASMVDPFRNINNKIGHCLFTTMLILCVTPCLFMFGCNAIAGKDREHYFRAMAFMFTRDERHLIIRVNQLDQVKIYRSALVAYIAMNILIPSCLIFIWSIIV